MKINRVTGKDVRLKPVVLFVGSVSTSLTP